MYCDYQVYAPIMAPQIMPRPSLLSSTQLFQVFSIALDRNLNDYLRKKIQKQAQNEQRQLPTDSKTKTNQTIIIDLQSDQEFIGPEVAQEKDAHSNNLKFTSANQTLADTSHKDEIMGVEENDSISQTPPKSLGEKSAADSQAMEGNELSLKCLQKWEYEEAAPLFSIECPKLGISNAQLLRKKQRLMRRNVVDWTQVDCKGPKQRREIRMLKN